MMKVFTWSDARVEQLKNLFEAGLSASQIAAELGGITRNAVLGKVHRLGLGGRAKVPCSAAPRQRRARPAQHVLQGHRQTRASTALAQELAVELEPDVFDTMVPMSQRLTLMQLNESTCHWPVGDPEHEDFFFCGGKSLTGLPYCAHHSRAAYKPAQPHRRGPSLQPA